MWWSVVITEKRDGPVADGLRLGTWNAAVLGEREAKRAARTMGRDYVWTNGSGRIRLIEGDAPLQGAPDLTTVALEDSGRLQASL